MSSYQAGLCLSCGAPFSPSLDDVDFFSQRGNRCVLFLHREFRANVTLQRTYVSDTLKFTGKPHSSHVFHDAHHIRAIRYMTQRHAHDASLTWPAAVPPNPRQILPNTQDGPIAFYLHPRGEARGPGVAVWTRPAMQNRLDFRPLLMRIRAIASLNRNRNRLLGQNLDQTFFICEGCNALMTQEANMKYHLGITNTANQNSRGCIIPPGSIRTRSAEPGAFHIDNAYGNWTFDMTAAIERHPNLTASDALTPHVAYYLHMCLPFFGHVHHFHLPGSDRAARNLYLELSWVILEIACLVTLLEEGKRYGAGKLSHGPHQHLGVLDFYVSYFLWRLLQFEFTERVNRSGLDFIQWHQKYYWEAIHCSALFPRNTGMSGIIGYLAYGNPELPSRLLLQDICARLMRLYTGEMKDLILFVTGHTDLPPEIQDYFVPLQAMRELRNRSHHKVRCTDFQSALETFGITALLSRIIQLCTGSGCPKEFRNQLLSFRSSWQWMEIKRIKSKNPAIDMRTAHRLYVLCSLLHPPIQVSSLGKDHIDEVLSGPFCSPWTAVIAREGLGAFSDL